VPWTVRQALQVSLVSVSSVRDSDPVQSRSEFERVSYEQVEWGIDRLKSVVEPAVGMGKGLEYFEARDRAEGLSGERSNAGVFRWFYGENTAMKVRTGSDGTGELINGRHRLFVARRMGIDSLPMDVR
jgi:hypothetical protein